MISTVESYRYAEKITRARAKNFYYTFWFLPPERRKSIFAVYTFSRRADDAVDSRGEGEDGRKEARAELGFLRSLLGASPPEDPLVPALKDTIERFSIPRAPFDELLRGMEMDLVKRSYETFDELFEYCYRAAAVIGLISIEIFGYEGPNASELAVKLGVAMQLTNILRDLKEDQARGRVYLPREDLDRFGYSLKDLHAGVANERFRDLMRFEVERARAFFKEAEPLFPLIQPESRYCPILLMRFYSRILDRIERQRYDVLRRRPSLPWHEKLRIAGRTWLEARSRSHPKRCDVARVPGEEEH
jgi:phytoene synthase